MFNLCTYILPSNRGWRKNGREGGKNKRSEGGRREGGMEGVKEKRREEAV